MYQPSTAQQQRWQEFLTQVKQLIITHQLKLPKIFISYAWEGDATATSWLHQRLIRLRDDLNTIGTNVFLDVSGMTGDIEKMMKEKLDQSDMVLSICTPNFGERVNQLKCQA